MMNIDLIIDLIIFELIVIFSKNPQKTKTIKNKIGTVCTSN